MKRRMTYSTTKAKLLSGSGCKYCAYFAGRRKRKIFCLAESCKVKPKKGVIYGS